MQKAFRIMVCLFYDDVDIPYILKSDLAPEITVKHTEFQAQVKLLGIDLIRSEVELSNQNIAAEGEIGHLKKRFGKIWCPKRLLSFVGVIA